MLAPTPDIVSTNGRPMKFTPERLEQIKNLVERGQSKEQIAEIVGCTVGSLQVTCSRLGISLRRRPHNGSEFKPQREEPMIKPDPNNVLEPPGGWPPPSFTLKLEFGDKSVSLPLDRSHVLALIMEAEAHGLRFSEYLAQILKAASERE